jgi:hypothetical protein
MNSQSEKNDKCDFRLSLKIKDLQSLILAAHPCTAGTSEMITGSLIRTIGRLWIGAFQIFDYYFPVNPSTKPCSAGFAWKLSSNNKGQSGFCAVFSQLLVSQTPQTVIPARKAGGTALR